jgi:hypothetical protein
LLILLALALAQAPASAQIYKYYDSEGNLVLSDAMPKDRFDQVEKLEAKPVMTVPAMRPDRRQVAQPVGKPPEKPATTAKYAITVLSPEAEGSYIRGADPIPVAISVTPALGEGHKLEFLLDDKPVGTLSAIPTENMERGSHGLVARVVDQTGKVMESRSVSFHIQQHRVMAKPKPGKK